VRWLFAVAIGAGTLWAVVLLVARVSYRLFIYPGAGDREAASELPRGFERLRLSASDGALVTGLWTAPSGATTLVVYFHGNGNVAEDQISLAQDLERRGLAVLLAEYRGYGASRGTAPDEPGLYRDAETVLDEAKRRGFPAERVCLWGASLGTGVATEMAYRHRGTRLVLISPFLSLTDAARVHAPSFIPVSLAIPDRYASAEKARFIEAPTLVSHGDNDGVIPFDAGRRLAGLFPHGRFFPIEGAGHNDVYDVGGATLLDAIVEHCVGQ
jgi:alpha-beta hydrolase superfamily lysophospholipase